MDKIMVIGFVIIALLTSGYAIRQLDIPLRVRVALGLTFTSLACAIIDLAAVTLR